VTEPEVFGPAWSTAPGQSPRWWIYRGTGRPLDVDLGQVLPAPPPWRRFDGGPVLPPPPEDHAEPARRLGAVSSLPPDVVDQHEVDMVNAALYLRRPLLVTGRPGTGKSALAYRIARELGLGRVLRWPITSSSSLAGGLYDYDAIGRVQAAGARRAGVVDTESEVDTDIGNFIQLGPLGTALLPYELPRVLLIDEIDKSDIDLPNDLLAVLEDGEYPIRELARLAKVEPEITVYTDDPGGLATIHGGRVRCRAFPFIVITSNGEREFPPAFLRRCLRLEIREPDIDQLAGMVTAHFQGRQSEHSPDLIRSFVDRSERAGGLAADQLLNAVHLATSGAYQLDGSWQRLVDALWRRLSAGVE
jgi:MoxR-like ATPase